MKTDPNETNKIEFNKLQGFDVLEKLPEEKLHLLMMQLIRLFHGH